MRLGCIGDDFTGSSDLGNTLAKGGLRTVQYVGVPSRPAEPSVEAGVVALKSRTIPPAEAVAQSLAALDWLRDQGCERYFLKYCSTFDSTSEGNIGPVVDALADALDARRVIVCPAFPGTGRTLYNGHLFVGDRLLSESGMQDHPLTPMTDPDIRRWLSGQTRHEVGLVPAARVLDGAAAIREALDAEDAAGHRIVVVDALRDADLMAIGEAARDLPLVTGGSGVALGLPAALLDGERRDGVPWRGQEGPCVALSGSCSRATREQVARHLRRNPGEEVTAADAVEGGIDAGAMAERLLRAEGVPLVYSSADPDTVREAQARFGRERASAALERVFADLARALRERGVTRIVTAGGETSGAVVEALAPEALEIGPEIAPGVPALRAGPDLAMALKSGNFGAQDFFADAARVLAGR